MEEAAKYNVLPLDDRPEELTTPQSEETQTTIGISELFANGAVIFSELGVPVIPRVAMRCTLGWFGAVPLGLLCT